MRENLNILITGASRGIGNAIACAIAHRAENLIVTSQHSETLKKGIEKIRKGYDGVIHQYNVDQFGYPYCYVMKQIAHAK